MVGSGDSFSTTTLITNNELSPIQPINPGKFAICGDGTLTTFTGEECDDGNDDAKLARARDALIMTLLTHQPPDRRPYHPYSSCHYPCLWLRHRCL